jgi:hypothetical protein
MRLRAVPLESPFYPLNDFEMRIQILHPPDLRKATNRNPTLPATNMRRRLLVGHLVRLSESLKSQDPLPVLHFY